MGSGYVVQTLGAPSPAARSGSPPTARPARDEWRTGYGLAVSADGGGRRLHGPSRPGPGDRPGRRPGAAAMPSVPGGTCTAPVVVPARTARRTTTSNGCADPGELHPPPAQLATSLPTASSTRTGLQTVSTGRGRWLGGITPVHRHGHVQRDAPQEPHGQVAHLRQPAVSDISPDRSTSWSAPRRTPTASARPVSTSSTSAPATVVHSWTSAPRRHSTTYFDEVWEDADPPARRDLPGRRSGRSCGSVSTASMEYAVAPVADDDGAMESPFHLQTR